MIGATLENGLKVVGSGEFRRLTDEAAVAARGRTHVLLHPDHSDQVQRLIVALSERTYVRPHRHPKQWELLVLLRGAARVLLFGLEGLVEQTIELSPSAASVLEIPAGRWHSLVPLQPATVLMEVKPGPFRPGVFAPWAPEENAPSAPGALDWLEAAREGDLWTA